MISNASTIGLILACMAALSVIEVIRLLGHNRRSKIGLLDFVSYRPLRCLHWVRSSHCITLKGDDRAASDDKEGGNL